MRNPIKTVKRIQEIRKTLRNRDHNLMYEYHRCEDALVSYLWPVVIVGLLLYIYIGYKMAKPIGCWEGM